MLPIKRINSRSKGQRGERHAIAAMEEWTGYEFSRVPASGGLNWKKNDNITGDIICSDDRHRCFLSIEVKNYEAININRAVIGLQDEIKDFWIQALRDAERGHKVPFLMFRYNGLKKGIFFIAISLKDFYLYYPHLNKENKRYCKLFAPYGKIVIMHSDMLFKANYKNFHKINLKIIKAQWPKYYKDLKRGL